MSEVDAAWLSLYQQARGAWPGVALTFERFTAHLDRLTAASPDGTAPSTTNAGDLFLCFGCLDGDGRAVGHFEQHILSAARGVVARMRADDDFIDEVLQELRAKLLVGEPKALAGYTGRGPLGAWVRVAASRAAIDALRAAGAAPPTQDVPEALEGNELGPEVRLLLETHRSAFQQTLTAALAELSVQDRNLLRRHLVDGMTLEEIAKPYAVHPATIARRLASLREDIATAVRTRMAARFGSVSGDQLESVFRAIRSQVYVSLSPLLASMPRQEGDVGGGGGGGGSDDSPSSRG